MTNSNLSTCVLDIRRIQGRELASLFEQIANDKERITRTARVFTQVSTSTATREFVELAKNFMGGSRVG